ncbi:7001_t:CDS:1 [Paraglomus occultum]|uniref:7001_t:CDS:1 n=1 Tax=Paraglomus occultum TaxID=144539 RepID=A0A9N9G255_9GLOM|nr:7001_t:CDS:1 [Paraglomus occultum]
MNSNLINESPNLRQPYSLTELCTATNSTCTATCLVNNLTPSELELFCNPPYTLTLSCDSILNPIRKRRQNSGKKSLPPRPQNGWILFRRNFESQVRSQCPGGSNTLKEISKLAAESWKSQPEKVQQYFNVLSKLASHKHKIMYPEYVYNPKKFKNGENFVFRHVDKDKIVKSRNSKASLSKKTKPSNSSKGDYTSIIKNEGCPENNRRQSILLSPSTFVDFSDLLPSLHDLFMLSPNFIQYSSYFSQCQFYNDINDDNRNAAKQISYTNLSLNLDIIPVNKLK